VREVRVVDEAGEQLGVMTPREALDIARGRGLDLIEVAPAAQPPVCRIMDYGKFKYEQGKKDREASKKQRQSEMKGMTLRPGTDEHDLDIKTKNIVKFLADGDKVKVTVRFRSREMAHPEFAQRSLQRIVDTVVAAGVGGVERVPLMEGRQMILILAPQRDSAPAAGNAPKKPAAPSAPRPAPAPRPDASAPPSSPSESAPAPVSELQDTAAPVAVTSSEPEAATAAS
jgi:translation initiation factor IF-3